jgi:hypothetical protein
LRKSNLLRLLFSLVFLAPSTVHAQAPAEKLPAGAPDIAPAAPKPQSVRTAPQHRFWDKENTWLFGGIAAFRTLDYFSTLNMRRRGRQEILLTNDAVDNHPAFAAIEAATAGVSIGTSFLFHRYGHHKLERWTSFVHIGLAATGSVRNYCLETAHKKVVP